MDDGPVFEFGVPLDWANSGDAYPEAPKRLVNFAPGHKKKSNKPISDNQLHQLLDKPVKLVMPSAQVPDATGGAKGKQATDEPRPQSKKEQRAGRAPVDAQADTAAEERPTKKAKTSTAAPGAGDAQPQPAKAAAGGKQPHGATDAHGSSKKQKKAADAPTQPAGQAEDKLVPEGKKLVSEPGRQQHMQDASAQQGPRGGHAGPATYKARAALAEGSEDQPKPKAKQKVGGVGTAHAPPKHASAKGSQAHESEHTAGSTASNPGSSAAQGAGDHHQQQQSAKKRPAEAAPAEEATHKQPKVNNASAKQQHGKKQSKEVADASAPLLKPKTQEGAGSSGATAADTNPQDKAGQPALSAPLAAAAAVAMAGKGSSKLKGSIGGKAQQPAIDAAVAKHVGSSTAATAATVADNTVGPQPKQQQQLQATASKPAAPPSSPAAGSGNVQHTQQRAPVPGKADAAAPPGRSTGTQSKQPKAGPAVAAPAAGAAAVNAPAAGPSAATGAAAAAAALGRPHGKGPAAPAAQATGLTTATGQGLSTGGTGSSFLNKMRERLAGGRFRQLNEELYTRSGDDAFKMMQRQPELFSQYHGGFQQQTKGWPKQPVDVAIQWLKGLPKELVVADFGCGDAKLAASVQQKVHSFDLVASAPGVIACNMANVPLPSASVDAAVFSLALMGTDYGSFLQEAARVLKPKGWLWIAEVRSRFVGSGGDDEEEGGREKEDFGPFLKCLTKLGMQLRKEDARNKMFVVWLLRKGGNAGTEGGGKTKHIVWPQLKACVYKKR